MVKIHICGIGGEGLSWIAKVLIERGWDVSGCDVAEGSRVGELKKLGLKSFILGHSVSHLDSSYDYFLYTSAISSSKEARDELSKALELKIQSFDRNAFFPVLLKDRQVIAVAGTHGKTSTTAMTAFLLDSLGNKCGFGVGGTPLDFGTNGREGDSKTFVIEADEFGKAFLGLRPFISVVTELELDHTDYFQRFNDYLSSFKDFIKNTNKEGYLVGFGDNDHILKLFKGSKRSFKTYGYKSSNDLVLKKAQINGFTTHFEFTYEKKIYQGKVPLPGAHYALNALGALTVANLLGYSFDEALLKLANFKGVSRRFETALVKGVYLVNDYAHHPTEVKATIKAAKSTGKRVIAIFEPHQYARSFSFKKEFEGVLQEADVSYMTSIYASREKEPYPISNEEFFNVCSKGVSNCHYVKNWEDLTHEVLNLVKKDDLILVMAVGNGDKIINSLKHQLSI